MGLRPDLSVIWTRIEMVTIFCYGEALMQLLHDTFCFKSALYILISVHIFFDGSLRGHERLLTPTKKFSLVQL
jgi:hypothetical protein